MLTLGLMEGIFTLSAIAMLLMGGTNANLPLHRILGPPALGLLAVVAYAVYDTGAVENGGQLLGLLTWAALGILIPLGVLQWTWAENKRMDAAPPRPVEQVVHTREATIHEHRPTRRERREERKAHKHAA